MRTLEDLGWPTLIEHWATRCATFRGARSVRGGVLLPSIDAARERAAQIREARDLASRDARLPVGGISEIGDAIGRVRKAAALDATELVAVATTARSFAKLRAHLRQHAQVAPKLAVVGEALADLGHVYHPILEAFDVDGRLVDHASDALGPLRKTLASIKAELDRRMITLLSDERFAPYLQDGYVTQREDRYVLPVRTDGKGFVRGIVHGTSQTGQTLFIEPDEIVDLNNRMKLAECDVADEERRILVKFSGWVAEEADGFEHSAAAAELLDVIAAAAIMADDTAASEPILDAAPRVALLHARHPLMLLAERRCIANDIAIDAGHTLVVSGPNAGGKTVALKTVGLAAMMARAGLHLNAESGSVMGWFTDVRCDIGDAQDLARDLSTFSGHMVNLKELLATAGQGSLVLIDEVAVGTDPDQGAALAQAVLEALAERGATCIVTTHYERLKALGTDDGRFGNASVGFDLARLEPTFKLHLGTPGSSGAFAVAQRMGIATPVVARARELLGTQSARIEDMLASLADQRRRIEEERAALLAEIEALEGERAASRMQRETSRMRFEKEQRTVHNEALFALKAARKEIDDVRREVRAKAAVATAEDVKEAQRKLAPASNAVAKHEPKRAQLPGTPARAEQLVQGAPVIVPRLGRAEVVALAPDDKVEVRVGSMRALVPVAEVLLDSHRGRRAEKAAAGRKDTQRGTGFAQDDGDEKLGPGIVLVDGVPAGGRVTARTIDSTIDVRGQRADEAISIVDRFVDESMMAARDAVFIVHGHGTGVLRSAIRGHLGVHKAIEKFRAGEPNEGGDGITVAFLRG